MVFIYTKLYFEIVLLLPACYFRSEVTVVRTQAGCLQAPGTATVQRQHYLLLRFLMFRVTLAPFSQSVLPKATGHVQQSAETSSHAPVCHCPSQALPAGCRLRSSVFSWHGRRTLSAAGVVGFSRAATDSLCSLVRKWGDVAAGARAESAPPLVKCPSSAMPPVLAWQERPWLPLEATAPGAARCEPGRQHSPHAAHVCPCAKPCPACWRLAAAAGSPLPKGRNRDPPCSAPSLFTGICHQEHEQQL